MITYGLPSSGERITLTDGVLSHLTAARQTVGRSEAGGQLFATVEPKPSIDVVRATGPSRCDRRGRFRFMPNRWWEQVEINRMYREGLHYVGDWHTHPEQVPIPSKHDTESIADCYRKSRKEIGGFILIIVGLDQFPQGLYVGLTDGAQLLQLAPTRNAIA